MNRLLLMLCLFSMVAVADPIASRMQQLNRKVIVIHSYLPGEWYHGINRTFVSTLENMGFRVDLSPYVFHSAYWEKQSQGNREKEKNKILKIIRDKKPDLVLICDDEAADFLITALEQSNIPTLFTGVNRSRESLSWAKSGMAGVLETYPFDESLSMLKKLKPRSRSISILSSQIPTSKIAAESLENTMNAAGGKAKFALSLRKTYLLKYWEEWKTAIEEIATKDDAVWILVPYDVLDSNNQEMSIASMGEYLTQRLNIPTLGIISIHTKIGLFAAINIGPDALGRQSAEQAARYFSGTSLAKIGIENARYHNLEINLSEAKRLRIAIPQEFHGIAKFIEKPFLKYGR